MKLTTCLHPKIVYNQYIHDYVVGSCGKCVVCQNRKHLLWKKRLEYESRMHPYVVFFTLTYAPNFVPTLKLHGNILMSDDLTRIYTIGKNQNVIKRVENDNIEINMDDLMPTGWNHELYQTLYYARKRDIQLFMKRVRSYIHELHEEKRLLFKIANIEKVSYYIVSEYGPKTYRPHFHGLLFIDSSFTFEKIDEILHKSWKNGFINWSLARQNASQYVAKYVNSVNHYPKVYEHEAIKSFSLCSKRPVIGARAFVANENYAKAIFNKAAPVYSVFDVAKKQSVDVPLFRSLESRVFPRITGFSRISVDDRVTLYGFGKKFLESTWCENTVKGFEKWLKIYERKAKEEEEKGVKQNTIYALCEYLGLYKKSVDGSYGAMRNLYYQLMNVERFRRSMNLSVNSYVEKVDEYYHNKAMLSLANQCNFYNEFQKHDKLQFAINIDQVFVKKAFETNYWLAKNDALWITCETFKLDHRMMNNECFPAPNVEMCSRISPTLTYDYRDTLCVHTKIAKDSLKTKRINDSLGIWNFNYE